MKKRPACLWLLITTIVVVASACFKEGASDRAASTQLPDRETVSINDGLKLPEGFSAIVVIDSLGPARHLTVRDNGDLYVALWKVSEQGGGIAALRDTTGDGRADIVAYFGEDGGTGIHVRGEYLYFASRTRVLRYPLAKDSLLPVGTPEVVVSGFSEVNRHPAKPFEFDDQGWMYVNVGAPSNACQDPPYTAGASGLDPCPQLGQYAGVWRFRANRLNQTKQMDGYRYATGIRNGVANAWNPLTRKLYVASHGRGYLHRFWPDVFRRTQDTELPAEELFRVEEGSDFGWPYCYYDHLQSKKLLNPEYGGDGTAVGCCDGVDDPVLAFPGHWAPNDLLFYTGSHFPERYYGGLFLAFHGSVSRIRTATQRGFRVVFVPFENDTVTGGYETFANGFTGPDTLAIAADVLYRPMGLAQGPSGTLFISDSKQGRVWRITYGQ